MYVKFSKLKEHFGKATMMEVLRDETLRGKIGRRLLYRDGKPQEIYNSNERGLYVLVQQLQGGFVYQELCEDFLDSVMIHAVDYNAITGELPTEEVIIDIKAVEAETEKALGKEQLNRIKAAWAAANTVIVVGTLVATKLGASLNKPASKPVAEPRSRKR